MITTKNFILTSFLFCFIAFSAYSQQDDQFVQEAKKESKKASEYLNLNQDQEVYLQRAIYSYKRSKAKINSVEDLSEAKKEEYLQNMEDSFENNVKNALGGDEQLTQKFFERYEKK